MYEIPEAKVVAGQINETIIGKIIMNVTPAHTPHKLAWYYGNPSEYQELLSGKSACKAMAYGGLVEIEAGDAIILLGEGLNIRYFAEGEKLPDKHQLDIEFEDNSHLIGYIQMYGGMGAFPAGGNDNKYYLVAKEKPSPLSKEFDEAYFESIIRNTPGKLSLKALLATEQRIPGLGNGVLQDILFNAGMHPKKKVESLDDSGKSKLFNSLKTTLLEMTAKGGRDTERDLFGCSGGYKTILSKNTVSMPCPVCAAAIKKEAYMGGSIYYCANCQKL